MQVTRLSLVWMAPTALALVLTSACGKTTDKVSSCTLAGGSSPAAAPAAGVMPACQSQMFAKYGIAGFGAVNSTIVNIAANPNQVGSLGDSFQTKIVAEGSARITQFTNNLAAFLIDAYGNPTDPNYIQYTGPAIPTIHAGLNITTAQYNYFITNVVVAALTDVGVSQDDITNCFAPQVTDPNFVGMIVSCN